MPKALPQIRVRLGGVLQTAAPQRPWLVIKLNGALLSAFRAAQTLKCAKEGTMDDGTNVGDDSDSEDEEEDEPEVEADDGPEWMFEDGKTVSDDPMSFALQCIESSWSTCSQSISVSTPYTLNTTEHIPLKRSAAMLSLRCINSVKHVGFGRSGAIYGGIGTHQIDGNSGHAQLQTA